MNIESMWQEYTQTQNRAIRENLIAHYMYLVKLIALRIYRYIGINVEYDDLVGYGYLGLIDAIDRFDLNKGVKFETYAKVRIRGAIMDGMKEEDYLKSHFRRKVKLMQKEYMYLGYDINDFKHDKEVAKSIGISTKKLNQFKKYYMKPVSFEQILENDIERNTQNSNFENIEDKVIYKDMVNALNIAIDKLPNIDKKVLKLYYKYGLSMNKIAKIIGVHQSYISHIHLRAVKRLNGIMYRYNSSTMV